MALSNDSPSSYLWRIQWRERAFQWLREKRQYDDFDLDSCLKRLEENPLIREAALAAFWGAYLANEVPPVLSDMQLERARNLLDYSLLPGSQVDLEDLALVKLHLAGLLAINIPRPNQPIIEGPSTVEILEKALQAYRTYRLARQSDMDAIIDYDPAVWGNQYFYADLFVFSSALVGGIAHVELSFWRVDQRDYEEAFYLITNGAWEICAATVESKSGELADFKPYMPHSTKQFNIQEVADIFEEIKRHPRETTDWSSVNRSCEAIQFLGHSSLYGFLDKIRDANGEAFSAEEYWGRAATFAEDQFRVVTFPVPIVTRDATERVETKERLRRDFFPDLWEELEQKSQELLIDAEIQWMHHSEDNMMKDIRPVFELELPAVFSFLDATMTRSDHYLILTRMKKDLLENNWVRASIDGLKIDSCEKIWAKHDLPLFLHKVIEARNYFEKEQHLTSKDSGKHQEMIERAVSIHRELLGIGCEGVLPRLVKIKRAAHRKK